MARPVTISDEQIIEAARALVTEHGAMATAQQIAARANVSEGTVFRRFRTKTELLQTVLGVEPPQLTAPFDALLGRVGKGSPIDNLREAGRAFGDLRWRVESLSAARRTRAPGLPLGGRDTKEKITRSVEAYLMEEVARGRVLPLDAGLFATTFVSVLFGLELSPGRESMIDGVVGLLFRDLAPTG